MNKPAISPTLPGAAPAGKQALQAPSAFVQQPTPVNAQAGQPPVAPARPAQQAAVPEYVDPYLFATGYYDSPAEYEALSRTGATRLRLRADVEKAKPKRRTS